MAEDVESRVVHEPSIGGFLLRMIANPAGCYLTYRDHKERLLPESCRDTMLDRLYGDYVLPVMFAGADVIKMTTYGMIFKDLILPNFC